MEVLTIKAEKRDATGSHEVARLRATGRIPCVLYGGGEPNVNLFVEAREMEAHLRHHLRVFRLSVSGAEQPIYLQDVQWDTVSDHPLHLDFRRIAMNEPIHLTVEINYVGHPVGLGKGGRLVKDLMDLKVVSLPAAIPDGIDVNIAHLEVGDKLHAGDIELPEGVTLDVAPDTPVCHVAVAVVKVEVAPEAPGEAAGEGEGAAAEAAPPEGGEEKG